LVLQYSVEFTDYRTGNLIKTTTGWSLGPTATLLYNPDNPAEVRFDTGVRPCWAKYIQSNVVYTVFISDFILAIMIFLVVKSPLTPSYLEESKEIVKPEDKRKRMIAIGSFLLFLLTIWLSIFFNLQLTWLPLLFLLFFALSLLHIYTSRRKRALPKQPVQSQPLEIVHTLRCPQMWHRTWNRC